MTLKGKRLLAYINESRIRSSEWDIWNSQAMILISNSLEPQLFETFYCEIALDL
jgi:hypothetical protein